MPQQPNMGGQKPYQPVGANNGPFHQNPVAPVQQPMQPMPPQGKGGVAQPAPQQPVSNMPNNLPSGLSGLIQQPGQPMGSNMNTGFGGINGVMQPGQPLPPGAKGGAVAQPAIMPMQQPPQGKGGALAQPVPQQPNQGKGPSTGIGDMPAYRGPVQAPATPQQMAAMR
jgi:hypothetical protein